MSKKRKKGSAEPKRKKPLLLRGLKWLLVAGLWVGIALATLTAWYAAELPGIIESPHFERRSAILVTASDDTPLARYGEMKGVSISVDALPPYLVEAVLATEDRRFYQHFGIDPVGLARAMARNVIEGRVVQGGSTITQQLAKNLFLSHERTLKRKIQEALLALWLESQLTKDEILTAYLNRVYLGAGAYGVDAASRTYFGKPATEISLYESAVLAGLLKAPSRYSPQSNPGLAAQRARVVLSAMRDAGFISEAEEKSQSLRGQAALAKPEAGQGERYFTDWVTANLDDLIGPMDKNLTIRTTLSAALQEKAEDIFSQALRENKEKGISQGALVVMGYDGAILAMVGGADFKASQFNRATQSKRPPGSSFKPFVYLAAIEAGWNPDDWIEDAPIREGKYRPANFDNKYLGEATLADALALSLNTATVRLAKEVGIGEVIDLAHRAGIESDLEPDLSLSLGSGGVPLIEMVTAYATIANEGTLTAPYAIERITDEDGNLFYVHAKAGPGARAVSRYAARTLTGMMTGVIDHGTGQRARLPFPAAGKTGTSQDFRDAWFIGFTDRYIAGVWLGNDNNSSMKGVTGGSVPAGIWRDVMLAAYEQEKSSPATGEDSEDFFRMLKGIFND